MRFPSRHSGAWFLLVLLLATSLTLQPGAQADPVPTLDWVRQFEGSSFASAFGTAVGTDAVYVAGNLFGTLPDQTSLGEPDGFLRNYSLDGGVLWTRQISSDAIDSATDVDVWEDRVYVAGWTDGSLQGGEPIGERDAFLIEYDADGDVVWTRQFGTPRTERVIAVDADAEGVYVVGRTNGSFPDAGGAGGFDAFIRRYDHGGNALWTRQFGTPPTYPPTGGEAANDVRVHATGVYVVGWTAGTLPNQTRNASAGGWTDGFLRKYDANGTHLWTRQFGTGFSVKALAVAVDSTGVSVGGQVDGAFPGQEHLGFMDAFLLRYDHDGRPLWTRQFGTDRTDEVVALAANETGVYALGNTRGAVGQTHAGDDDAFLAAFTPNGSSTWTFQFGTTESDQARSVALHPDGLYVAGMTKGDFESGAETDRLSAFLAKTVLREADPAPVFWLMVWGGVAAVTLGTVLVFVIPRRIREPERVSVPPEFPELEQQQSKPGS